MLAILSSLNENTYLFSLLAIAYVKIKSCCIQPRGSHNEDANDIVTKIVLSLWLKIDVLSPDATQK
jgi:hypothetical protein